MQRLLGRAVSCTLLALLLAAHEMPADAATLRIEFGTHENSELKTEKYLAVASWHDGWDQPLVERILSATESGQIDLELPPGGYRVFCSAAGHSLAFKTLLELTAAGAVQACRLRPLVPLLGRVQDSATGEPVAGAKVGFATLGALESPIRLSPLGDEHLRLNYVVRTGIDGTFSLPVIPNYRSSLLIEAPGYGAKLLQEVTFPGLESSIGDIRLQRGGTIAAKLIGPLPEGLGIENYKWAVRPESPEMAELSYYLDRPLRYEETTEWTGLDPGRYEIWLRGRVKEAPGLRPYRLITVELMPGTSEILQLQVPHSRRTTPKSDLNIRIPRGLEVDEQVTLDLWHYEELTTITALTVQQGQDAVVTVEEVCESGAVFVLRTASRISRAIRIEDSCFLEVPLEEAANLQARLAVPQGHVLPRAVTLSLVPCQQGFSESESLGPFPVRVHPRNGTWTAMAPAGCNRGLVRSRQFAPASWSAISLKPGGVYDLGTLQLTLGAALLVRVSDEENASLQGATVKVIAPEDFQNEAVQILANQPALEGIVQTTDAWGWARFVGLPPGEVHLGVWAPRKAPAFTEGLRLEPGRELLVDDLNVQAPAVLNVSLSGIEDFPGELEPTVLAQPFLGCGWFPYAPVFGEPIQGDGSRFRLLGPPGHWKVEVGSRADGSVGDAFLTQEIEVFSGQQELELNLSETIFRGRLKRAGLPVTGQVLFRAEFGREGSSTAVETAEDGTFQVALEAAGSYSVQVRETEAASVTTIPGIKVTSTDQDILIEFPVGAIRGRVFDPQGVEVAGVSVTAVQYPESTQGRAIRASARSDESGAFLLEGLRNGVWRVHCQSGAYRCIETVVDLLPDEQRSDVETYLSAPLAIQGRVTTAQGHPVASAELQIVVWVPRLGKQPVLQTAFTGADGYFEAALDPNYAEVDLWNSGVVSVAVKAPGSPIAAFRSAYSSQPIALELPATSSHLKIRFEAIAAPVSGQGTFILISEDGAWVLLNGFSSPGAVDWRNDSIVVPSIVPGSWKLIRIQQLADVMSLLDAGSLVEALASFEVLAGETTEVLVSLPE